MSARPTAGEIAELLGLEPNAVTPEDVEIGDANALAAAHPDMAITIRAIVDSVVET